MNSNNRFIELQAWIKDLLYTANYELVPLANDASFRKYYRLYRADQTYVVMDSPLDKEDPQPFMKIAFALEAVGVNVPRICASDPGKGFLLLTDFGNRRFLEALDAHNVDQLYHQAINTLVSIQKCRQLSDFKIPFFDTPFMFEELLRFSEWYLQGQLKIHLSVNEKQMLNATYKKLIAVIDNQPKLFIHRDYHSRNLMLLKDQRIGVLDFQDAMWGPISYDIVSLLKDCYIAWPVEKVKQWALSYWKQVSVTQSIDEYGPQQFLYWFDWMGLQRHLKAIGIFARLNLRDKKPGYLKDIPRTMSYVMQTVSQYDEFAHFKEFLEQKVLR